MAVINEIKNKKKSAEHKALELLSFRMRTENELYKKLSEYGYSSEEITEAVKYVKSFGYVNDRNYAEQYVISRKKRKGKALLRMDLVKKGVDLDIIDNALEAIEEDEKDIVYELLIKKNGAPRPLEEKEYAKLYRSLCGRGFSNGAVYKALSEFKNNALINL